MEIGRVVIISDSNYLSRCAILLESAAISEVTTVLALDKGVSSLSTHFPSIRIQRVEDFLENAPDVRRSIEGRSVAEKIFSIGPSVLRAQGFYAKAGSWLVYCDADLYFFQHLANYLKNFEDANVVISPHRHYWWNQRRLAKFGKYNVGMVAFRNNEEGLKALEFWAKSCLEWCYDKAVDGKYADQKYLENFSTISRGVVEDDSIGSNLAPWNSFLVKLRRDPSGTLRVNGEILWYFHFQGLRRKYGRWLPGYPKYFGLMGPRTRSEIYIPYIEKLEYWASKTDFQSFGTSRDSFGFVIKLIDSAFFVLSLMTFQTIRIGKRKGHLFHDSTQ